MANEIYALHKDFKFCGRYPNELLDMDPELLNYLISILHDRPIEAPSFSTEKWQDFIRILSPQGILPLIYYKTSKLPDVQKPPKDIMDNLRNIYMASSVQAMLIEKYFSEVCVAFKSENIDFIVLKGFAYARVFYPDPATRPHNDIDMMVRKEDLIHAHNILIKLNFICTSKSSDNFSTVRNEDGYIKKYNRCSIIIDLHYREFAYPGIIAETDINKYLQKCWKINDTLHMKSLDPTDSLMNACIHMCVNHLRGIRLIWLYDIKIISQYLSNSDWKKLIEKSFIQGEKIALVESLKLSDFWTGTDYVEYFKDNLSFSRKEQNAWGHLLKKHKSLISWLAVRWPKDINVIRSIILLIRYTYYMRIKSIFNRIMNLFF